MSNALRSQTSPYLLQHAENPVDWHPWGEEALRLALELDKPILLSIGYSACHWCHVMERESFEDAAIAACMNEHFVSIKVDREERPDLDKIYQSAHQLMTQRPGGWPLTLALSPQGHAPFFAGTYFPPTPRHGMPGFGEVLEQVAQHYRQHRARMPEQQQLISQALGTLNPQPQASAAAPPVGQLLRRGATQLAKQFDTQFGGFGTAPKFPHPTQLELLLRHAALEDTRDTAAAQQSAHMVDVTLRRMAAGGLFDQLGGGFYRYSVDRQWRIPHFEKMLYDNAQMLSLYSDACQFFSAPRYRAIVEHTAAWLMREMRQSHGAYAATLDADSEGVEGKYYVWSEAELRNILQQHEYDALAHDYALHGEPNFEDRWHLHAADLTDAPPKAALQSAREKLLAAREQRIRPFLDDKILTAWNGLAIKGLARAARILERPDFATAAGDALDFLRTALWRNGRLCATYRNGHAHLNGYLDDYAFLAEGIVELLQLRWRNTDLDFAVALCDALLEHFEDAKNGGFFFTSHDHETLLQRLKPGADDATPSGNGAAARALAKLGHLLGNTNYLQSATKTLHLFAGAMSDTPSAHASLVMASQACEAHPKTIILRGDPEQLKHWQNLSRQHYHPEHATFAIPNNTPSLPSSLEQRRPHGKITAYICQGFTCSTPITSLQEFRQHLSSD